MNLKNKHILITAGPTWVPIDSVRVISNIASGETGILLAQDLARKGAKVTLLLGPVGACCLSKKIRVMPFKFFDELKLKIIRELKTKEYDVLVHSAAVSDYGSAKLNKGKIKSGHKSLKLNLLPLPKIINLIKKIDPAIFLVGFKFAPNANTRKLIKEAKKIKQQARLDLVAANTFSQNQYRAYLVGHDRISRCLRSKKALIANLIQKLEKI